MDYEAFAHLYEHWIDEPGYPLERDFDEAEYRERLYRAREAMASERLDALVVTSSEIGRWFTSPLEPHEWHDLCQARSAWFILTPTRDVLCMTPTAGGEHLNTTRRSTWVGEIRSIVERAEPPRLEIWDLRQMPVILEALGIATGRLGFELGDCMTLGITVNDFLRLRDLLPDAELVDGSPAFRRLMSVHTPLEIERVRRACQAGVWIHGQVPEVLRPGLTEAEFFGLLADRFRARYPADYHYQVEGVWDVRNPGADDSNLFHAAVTDRPYRPGDFVFRGWSGVSYLGYPADVDRGWSIGDPSADVLRLYRIAWECNRAMAEQIRPGNTPADVYAACARVEAANGLPERLTGRVGHGLRNTGGLSVHPANRTILEPGMILSVEPMFATEHGFFDLEDQYVVTETGAEILHPAAPEHLPVISA